MGSRTMRGWPREKVNNYQWNQARGRRGREKYHHPYYQPPKRRQLAGNSHFKYFPQQHHHQQQQNPILGPISAGKHQHPQRFQSPTGYSQYSRIQSTHTENGCGGILVGQQQQKYWPNYAYNYQQQQQQEQALVPAHDEIHCYDIHAQQMLLNPFVNEHTSFVNDYNSCSATASKISSVNGVGNGSLAHGGTYSSNSNQVNDEYQLQPHSAMSKQQYFPYSRRGQYQLDQPHFQFQLPVGPHDENEGSLFNNARVDKHWQGNCHHQIFASHESASCGINTKESNLAISLMGSNDKIQNTGTSKKEDIHIQPSTESLQGGSPTTQNSESDTIYNNDDNESHPNLLQDELAGPLIEAKSLHQSLQEPSSPKDSCDPIVNPSVLELKLGNVSFPHDQLEEPISLSSDKHGNLDFPTMPICIQSYQPSHYHDEFSSFTINPDLSILDEIMYEQIQIVSSPISSPQCFEEISYYEMDDPESIISEYILKTTGHTDPSARLFTLEFEVEEPDLYRSPGA